MKEDLPEFKNPPVVEVALAVQFEPLTEFHTPQLGALWTSHFQQRFPRVEEHAPLEPMMERFGTSSSRVGVRVEMLNKPPTPRCWFVKEDRKELIQIQNDRFAYNWRKTEIDGEYPRYDNHLRPKFERELGVFADFVKRERIGEVKPNQCEITYVNLIEPGDTWERHGQLEDVLSIFSGTFCEPFLPEAEEVRASGSFIIKQGGDSPLGRLHFSVEPVIRKTDQAPRLKLILVARGAPIGSGIEGVLSFMDLGRKWIVRGFAALTTKKMHKEWGRQK